MAGSINKVMLIGNLGADPEIREMNSGLLMAGFSLATNQRWRNRETGEPVEKTEWHRIAIFDQRLVRVAEQFLRKGSKVYVEGQLRTRKWSDADGQDRYSTEVILAQYRSTLTLLDRKDSDHDSGDLSGGGLPGGDHSAPDLPDDSIPF